MREKELYNELTKEKKTKIENLDKKVDRNKLIYRYKGNTADVNFGNYYGAIDFINKIKMGILAEERLLIINIVLN